MNWSMVFLDSIKVKLPSLPTGPVPFNHAALAPMCTPPMSAPPSCLTLTEAAGSAAASLQSRPEVAGHPLDEEGKSEGDSLRVWVPACATGEEAYSIAILLKEGLARSQSRRPVQIFATDLDEEAIAFARRGVYSAASIAGLPADVLTRYFTRLDGTYEVTKSLRGKVIFGQHDLGQRSPFPRIDLVLCRNVLIYFTEERRQTLVQRFYEALEPGGYLFLGHSESISKMPVKFQAIVLGDCILYRKPMAEELCKGELVAEGRA
jgi:chemotaxis methyl-accepting protein methylase